MSRKGGETSIEGREYIRWIDMGREGGEASIEGQEYI